MSYVTVSMPCISIKHLSAEVLDYLIEVHQGRIEAPCLIAFHDNGFFITGTSEPVPKALEDIFEWAADKAPFGWIMIDVDGDVQPDLEVY